MKIGRVPRSFLWQPWNAQVLGNPPIFLTNIRGAASAWQSVGTDAFKFPQFDNQLFTEFDNHRVKLRIWGFAMLTWNILGQPAGGKQQLRRRGGPLNEAGPELVRSLRLVHQDVRNLALLIATTTSMLNVWIETGDDYSNEIRAYLPSEPLIITSLSSHLAEQGIHPDTMDLLQNFRSRVAFANGLLKWFKPNDTWDSEELGAEIEYIADAWRSLCALTVCVLYEVEGIVLVSGQLGHIESETVRHLLRAARDGGHPCIKDGRPIVPGWAERRAHKRFAVNLPALAMFEHGRSNVTIMDISRGGAGLDGAEKLIRGSKIGLAVAGDKQLYGTVQWVHGTRAGVKFFESLPEDEVLQLASVGSQG